MIVGASIYAFGLLAFLLCGHLLSDQWWYALLVNFLPVYFAPLVILLPLMLLWRARVASISLCLVGLYAFIVFGRYYFPKGKSPMPGVEISVTTFNVSEENRQRELVVSWLRQKRSDVVFLQEMGEEWAANGIVELRDVYPFQVHVALPSEQKGAAILSRFPLHDETNYLSFFRVVMTVDGQQLALYNVSLPTPLRLRPRELLYISDPLVNPLWDMAWSYDEAARNHELYRLHQQVESDQLPAIVAGDFNMSEYSSSYALWNWMGDSFREVGSGFGATWPAFDRIGFLTVLPPFIRLDYILHSPSLRASSATVGIYLGSDHLPVTATIQM